MIIGYDHELKWVSPSFEQTLGWAATAMIGQPWFNFAHPEDIDGLDPTSHEGISASELHQFENRYRHQDGSYRWFIWNVQRYPAERVLYGVAVDITDRKLAEAQLHRVSEVDAFRVKLSDALRSLADPIAIQAESTHVLGEYLNVNRVTYFEVIGDDYVVERDYVDQLPHLFGRYPVSSFGQTLLSVYQNGIVAFSNDVKADVDLAAAKKQAFADIQIGAYIGVPLVKNGQFVAGLTIHSIEPRQWTTSEITIAVETAERTWSEIERARAEAAVRQSEAKYRSLFESIDEGFCIIELIYDENGAAVDYRFLEVNRVFERQTKIANVAGKLISEIAPNIERYWLEAYNSVVKTGESVRLENYHQATEHWYSVYASRVGEVGSRQVGIVFDDITDRKRREANLAFLTQIQDDFAHLIAADEIIQIVGEKLSAYLNISNCLFAEINEAQDTATVEYVWHSSDTSDWTGVYQLSQFVTQEFQATARAKETIVICNTQIDPRTDADRYAAFNIHALITVPFHRGNEWKYLFTVNHSSPREWREDEIELVRELTSRTFPRLERAHAEAAAAADLRDMQLLRELGARLVVEGNIQALYQEIMTAAIALAHADAGSVQILDDATQDLVLLANQGFDQIITEHFFRVNARSNTACGRALRSGDRAFIDFDVPASEDPDGSLRIHVEAGYLSAQSTPLIARSGKAIGMVSTHWRDHHRPTERELRFLDLLARQAADLIEQRQSEQALRQSESRFRLMVESAKDYAIFTLNLNGIVTSWNVGAERLLGYADAEIVGRHGRIIFTPEDSEQEKPEQEMQIALTEGQAVNERWHVRQDSRRFWGSGLMMPLQDEAGTT
jgi:PAS domain S-box-containing protein